MNETSIEGKARDKVCKVPRGRHLPVRSRCEQTHCYSRESTAASIAPFLMHCARGIQCAIKQRSI